MIKLREWTTAEVLSSLFIYCKSQYRIINSSNLGKRVERRKKYLRHFKYIKF